MSDITEGVWLIEDIKDKTPHSVHGSQESAAELFIQNKLSSEEYEIIGPWLVHGDAKTIVRPEPEQPQQSQSETQPMEPEQIERPWEPSDGTPGRAAEPQRDRM